MGKKGKKEGDGRPTAWSLYVMLAVVVGLIAWTSLRQEVKQRSPKKEKKARELTEDEEGVFERLSMVQDALLSKDGTSLYDKSKGSGGSRFADPTFWEERYAKSKGSYDWYGTWNSKKNSAITIKDYVLPHLPQHLAASGSVLNIGCGSSRFTDELVEDGYRNITNVDISQTIIDKMVEKYEGQDGVRFQVMDITQMDYTAHSFDAIFDKGTLDALYTGASHQVAVAVAEVYRVLKPDGVFVSVTFGMPKARKELNSTGVEGTNWGGYTLVKIPKSAIIDPKDQGESSFFYIYILRKKP